MSPSTVYVQVFCWAPFTSRPFFDQRFHRLNLHPKGLAVVQGLGFRVEGFGEGVGGS